MEKEIRKLKARKPLGLNENNTLEYLCKQGTEERYK